MEVITIETQAFKDIKSTLEEIKNRVLHTEKNNSIDPFVDNQEFLKLLKISKRTAQLWRDEGRISFSQIGNKIYYKVSDVERLLNRHYKKAFAENGNPTKGAR